MMAASVRTPTSSMTESIRDYRDLLVWRLAVDLNIVCSTVADALPRREWSLASQIRRAANSVHANIAEGNGAFSTTDYIRHVGIAHKSLRELESHLAFVTRRYATIGRTAEAQKGCERVAQLLGGLRRSLRRKLDSR